MATSSRGSRYYDNERERMLVARYQEHIHNDTADTEEAKTILNELIANTIDFIKREATRYYKAFSKSYLSVGAENAGMLTIEDAIMDGVIGFICAIYEYDPKHNSKSTLLTYAKHSIRGAIITAFQNSYGAPRYAFDRSGLYEGKPAFSEWREILRKGGAIPFSYFSYEPDSDDQDNALDYIDSHGRPIFSSQEPSSTSDIDSCIDMQKFKKLLAEFVKGFPDLRKVPRCFKRAAKEARFLITERENYKKELEIFAAKFGLIEWSDNLKGYKEVNKLLGFYKQILGQILSESGFEIDV